MKLELKIEASGVQVYAYEINDEAKNLLEENAKNGSPRRGIEIVEEHARVTLISHGIAARNEGCKYSAFLDGKEKPFYPTQFEYAEMEDFKNSDYIEDAISMSDWPDTVDQNDFVWIPFGGEYEFKNMGDEAPIPEAHTVIFEVIPYSSGVLHTSFDVDEDFKLTDLKLVTDHPDTNDEYDLSWLYYCSVFEGILDQNGDKPFDEDTIRAVDYKGEQYEFRLDFQGGSGWYAAYEKEDGRWVPSFLKHLLSEDLD